MGYTARPEAITEAGNSMTATVEGTSSLAPHERLSAITTGMPGSLSGQEVAGVVETWSNALTSWRTDAETYAQGLRDSATTVEVVDSNAETRVGGGSTGGAGGGYVPEMV